MLPLPVFCDLKTLDCKVLHVKQQDLDLCTKHFNIIVQQ